MVKTNKKQVPIKDGRGCPKKYPFDKLKVKGSFEVTPAKNYSALNAARQWATREKNGRKFAGMLKDNVLTVWRIK